MFYNYVKLLYGTCGFLMGGFLVNEKEEYRKQIIEMIENVKRKDILLYIFNITKDIIKEDKENE
jgi:hypothetical protein